MPTRYRLSYYPWLTQHVPPAEIHSQIQSFAGEVAHALGDAVIDVLPPLEVGPQIDQLVAGASEIALMNPLGYVFARRRMAEKGAPDAIQSVAIALRLIDGKVGDEYFGQIYTRDTTALRPDDPQLAEKMRGRTIAFGVPYSTSNFLIPAYELLQAGLHPLTSFKRMEYAGGHDHAAKAVYEGRADLGAGHDGVIIDLGNQPGFGDAAKRMHTLIRSKPIPSDPVVVRAKDNTERNALQRALVAAGETAAGKAALARFWGLVQGLAPITADKYDVLNASMTALNLSERDLLQR